MAPKKPQKKLVDLLLERELADSASKAQSLIMAGKVLVNGIRVDKAGTLISEDATINVADTRFFVGRGALKLGAALKAFPVSVHGKVCADAGCSTGGFTQILLLSGAAKVFAIDSAFGVLDWKLRNDPRVVLMEKTRVLEVTSLPEPIELTVIDISLLPLRKILPSVLPWLSPSADVIALVKPQYEAEKEALPEGAVIDNQQLHREVLENAISDVQKLGCHARGLIASPILGKGGNKEFLLWFSCKAGEGDFELTKAIKAAVATTPGQEEEVLKQISSLYQSK